MFKTNLVRTSRDGDQFHYLWAARRCLKLLSADSDLIAISIEGPSPGEHTNQPPVSEGEELIDIAEYFGSENIKDARLVRYLQLKHSTLHAAEPWTASGIEKTIEGFAERYGVLVSTYSAEALSQKLQFWFVTNRPISAEFVEAVRDGAAEATPRHPKELEKLERFVGLSGSPLAAFLKLLHFEDRQDAYWDQRNILFQEVSGYLPDADVDAPTQLKELVVRRALSEGEQNPVITKMDVLRALNTDESRLFPARCLIKSPEMVVPRAQEPDLLRKIIEATEPVIVHASAGVGKTVFASRIAQGLPEGSACILYDCFGNGQYRSASRYRHRHKDALVQIANELASKALCHLLIPTVHADATSYLRAFAYRIGQAITLLRLANPGALLCIVVDAADNAQMAAEEIGEKRSFARDLIREKMPEGVRLVLLCRTHRQDYLDPPVETIRLELSPFSRAETATYLRSKCPEATDHDVDEFHRLSSENPRVQALALSRNVPLPEILRLLGPNPKSVEDTIRNLLESAIAKLRDDVGPLEKAQVDKICAGLAALRPLIPIPVLAQMSGVNEGAIRSFAIDIGRPLLVAGDTIQFFDEPAETWFRDKFRPSADAMVAFIATLKPHAAQSPYVASALPPLMLEAGKFSELVELALTSAALPETSPLERRDVELQRLQFALKAGLRTKRYVDAAKLALKAGGETAGDDRQRRILQANTDLAAIFLNIDLIQEIVSRRTFGSGWIGSHHAYEAALLSGCAELIGDARSRLRMANEWLVNWSRLTPQERKDEKEEISDQDIVELTLAHLNIHGPADAAYSLGRWSPRQVSFRIGRTVARRLIDHGRFQELEKFARAAGNNLCLVLAITVALREIQRCLPVEITKRALRLVQNKRVKLKDRNGWDDQETALNAVTALVEASLQQSLCTAEVAIAVLSRYLPNEPPRGLSSRFSKARFPILRAYCLRAALQGRVLELRDLAHAELRAEMDKKNAHSTSSDLQQFQEDIGALLPWHQLWAAALLGRITRESSAKESRKTREASDRAARVHYRDDFHTSNEIALLWFDVLHKLDAADAAALKAFSEWKEGLKRPLFTTTLTALARLGAQREATKAAALGFAVEAFTLWKEERSDAESKSEGYIEVARAILAISKSDAAAYFTEAVEVASKIGDENLLRWDAILDLADRAASADRPSPEVAYNFSRCAELTYDYVDRDKHFDWEATVDALCGLCPSSALAILSRWRDRGFGWSERILPVAVNCLIERGVLDARDALPLIGFQAQWAYDRLLNSALEKYPTHDEKVAVSAYLYRYAQFTGRTSSRLKEVASEHKITIAGLDDAIAFYEEKKRAEEKLRENEEVYKTDHSIAEPQRDWDSVFSGSDLTNSAGLSQAYAAFKKTETPWYHDQFYKEAARRVPVGSEPAFIAAVADTPAFDLYHFRNFLEQLPEAWKGRPAVAHALAETLKAFCRRFCMGITKNRRYEILPFSTACALSGMSEADIVGVVLDAVGETPDLADSGRLFSLVGLIAIKLTEDEALEALKFGLDLFQPTLEEKDGDGPWSNRLLPPTNIKISLAGYIWATMASPEGVSRWEGAHAVLGLVALGRGDVLSHLVNLAIEKKGGPFVDARLPFYSLHALQWFLIGIARGAIEAPANLAPFGPQIVNWALKDQPHILIRQFAARAAIALVEKGVVPDEHKLKERLAGVNISPLPVIESKSYERVRAANTDMAPESGEDRFYFGLDIGPYWLAPLGNVFGLTQRQIETETLQVIRNDFGFAGTGRWDEDERSRRKLYDENYAYHSQGSHPRADTLHFYNAYHAMMIVAGRLLASTPTHRNSDYGEADEFTEWLVRHDLTRKDGRWLWDRRDPSPSERPAWQGLEKKDDAWHAVTAKDFDEVLHSGSALNVWGSWTAASSEREQYTHIRSALVTPDKSAALLRALGTTEVHDYLIPSGDDDRGEIDESGFSLKGWVVDRSRDRELDGQDRWSGGIGFPPPMPAPYIVGALGIATDLDYRRWRDGKMIVMSSEVWGHYDEAKRHGRSDPERGSRFQASLGFLTEMLAKLNRYLIIEVQINRQRRYQPYESSRKDDERIPTKTRFYLVGTDGRFRTL
ncbi:MAG TPA: AVAST type 3 anti-phage nuclease/ATPase Avs3a [Xanthobacteraceae bacterium]|jgi:hypothetical protein|nr:AVAST type 3 anti-phage nuclease/ATPase Avs3a [Xanthobacteraceae bacterium]